MKGDEESDPRFHDLILGLITFTRYKHILFIDEPKDG